MKTYSIFQEYIWLVSMLRRYGKLSLEELNGHWVKTEMSGGVPIPRTTFNRHRDAILDMLGIIIDCDKKDHYRYYIANEEVLHENTIQNWMLSTLSVNNLLAESRGVHERILLESIPSDGEHLHRFIEAMKQSVRIIVKYRRYGAEEESTMLLDPYFVKLTNRRWYAVVKHPDTEGREGGLFTLAFDRIRSLELTDWKFDYDKDFVPARWFDDCYGIVNDHDVPVERVVIRAYGREAHYMRDLPLHHTQREIGQGEDYTDFELTLRPTADFFTPLLSRGRFIKVLEPEWVAEDVAWAHREAARLYEND